MMILELSLNQLNYQIVHSPCSNDHQVRLIVDGTDILGEKRLGLDPLDFDRFVQPESSGDVLVGRCDCGCIGCDDVKANVQFEERSVIWSLLGKVYHFEIGAYTTIFRNLTSDHSWEDIGRRVERILTERVQADTRWVRDQTQFDWVSTRCSRNKLTYSFTIDGQQTTFSTGWDGQTEDDAIAANGRLLHERFGTFE